MNKIELFNSDLISLSHDILLSTLAHPKFPEGTVAGLLKQAVAVRADQDLIRFDNQNINWSNVEFDVSNRPNLFMIRGTVQH